MYIFPSHLLQPRFPFHTRTVKRIKIRNALDPTDTPLMAMLPKSPVGIQRTRIERRYPHRDMVQPEPYEPVIASTVGIYYHLVSVFMQIVHHIGKLPHHIIRSIIPDIAPLLHIYGQRQVEAKAVYGIKQVTALTPSLTVKAEIMVRPDFQPRPYSRKVLPSVAFI